MSHGHLLAFFLEQVRIYFLSKIYRYSFFFFLMCLNLVQDSLNHLKGWEAFFSFCHKNVKQDSESLVIGK